MLDEPVCDAFATTSGDQLTLFLINRSLQELDDIGLTVRGARISGPPRIQVFRSDSPFASDHEVVARAPASFSTLEPCSVTLLTWPLQEVPVAATSHILSLQDWDFSAMAGWSFSQYGAANDVVAYATNGAQINGTALPTLTTPAGPGALNLEIVQAAAGGADNNVSLSFKSSGQLHQGTWYRVRLYVKTEEDCTFPARLIQEGSSSYVADAASSSQTVACTGRAWQTVEFLFTPAKDLDATRLPALYLGELSPQTIQVSSVRLEELIADDNLLDNDQFIDDTPGNHWMVEQSGNAVVHGGIAPDLRYPGGRGIYQFSIDSNSDTSSQDAIRLFRTYQGAIAGGELYQASFWLKVKTDAPDQGDEVGITLLDGQGHDIGLQPTPRVPCSGIWQRLNLALRANSDSSAIQAPTLHLGALPAGSTVSIADLRLRHIPRDEIRHYRW